MVAPKNVADSMQLIDTHTHLYVEQFESDRAATIERAISKGVEKFYLPAIDSETHDAMLALEATYPNRCFAMMGLHPCSVKADFEQELKIVKAWLEKRHFCAIGEIGIDLHWDTTFFEQNFKVKGDRRMIVNVTDRVSVEAESADSR